VEIGHHKLRNPLAVPSSQELAVMARLGQRLAPLNALLRPPKLRHPQTNRLGIAERRPRPSWMPSGARANRREPSESDWTNGVSYCVHKKRCASKIKHESRK
jgi:hypothetical protein